MAWGRIACGAAPRSLSAKACPRVGCLALGVVALLLALSALTGCGADASRTAAEPASPSAGPHPGGTFNYPLQWDPASLLPPRVDESSESEVAHQIYEGLVAYDVRDEGTVVTVPCLAESWTASDDARVWTFRLRRGVRFQPPVGRELTADDVVAAFRYVADPRSGSFVSYLYAIVVGTDEDGHATRGELGVEAVGRYTVRVTLKQPFAAFPDVLGCSAFWVWPVDYLQRVGVARFEASPVGTGPFLLSRRVRGEYVDLTRNPGWWNAASGQPYLESVHFRVFESVSAELLAFQQGLIDYTWVPPGQVVASRSLPQVRSGEWVARVLPVLGVFSVGFAWNDPVVGSDAGLTVRRALDCAIDRRALVDGVLEGIAVPETGLVPPVFPGWETEQPPQTYDPERAGELYRSAGSPRLRLVYWDDRTVAAQARWLRAACAAAGIPLGLRALPWDRFASGLVNGRYRLFFTGWLADYPSYDDFLYPEFHSTLSASSLGTGYADPDVDRLLDLARSTADQQRRLDLSRRAAHEILADKPVLPLYEFAAYRLLSARVSGFTPSTTLGEDMWKLWVE